VLKLPANADGAVVADMLGQLFEAPKRSFTISGGEAVTIDGRATRRVQLVPRTAGSVPFQKATLWLDDKEPRPVRVQVLDAQGTDRTITLTTWTRDAKLAGSAFRFSPPKGVKVVTKLPGI
jgi:outer membrane lipoprotein carrier protein